MPLPRRGADAHQRAGVEAKRAQREGALDHALGLVDVEARRREGDLEGQSRVVRRSAGGVRSRERRPGSLALVDLLRVAVEAHLNRTDRQGGEASGGGGIEALTIGLDLELNPGASQGFGQGEEVGYDHRLAAAEHHVRYALRGDIPGESDRLGRVELVGQPLAGRRVGAAMQAREVAVARELPADQERSGELVDAVHAPCAKPETAMPAVKSSTATR